MIDLDYKDIYDAIIKINPTFSRSQTEINTYCNVIMAVYLKGFGYSQEAIGKCLGKNHSSISHYWTNFEALYKYSKKFIRLYNKVMEVLQRHTTIENGLTDKITIVNILNTISTENLEEEIIRRTKTVDMTLTQIKNVIQLCNGNSKATIERWFKMNHYTDNDLNMFAEELGCLADREAIITTLAL